MSCPYNCDTTPTVATFIIELAIDYARIALKFRLGLDHDGLV